MQGAGCRVEGREGVIAPERFKQSFNPLWPALFGNATPRTLHATPYTPTAVQMAPALAHNTPLTPLSLESAEHSMTMLV